MERSFTLSIPARMRIDNAANIYPASLSRNYASLYRMSVTLTEPVDPTLLQQALETVSERIPTFRCGLRSGTFWWHLRRMDKDPEVMPAAPLSRFHFRDNGGFLYKVSAEGCRIVLDVFHALADGTGSETFLLTLAGEYLRLKYGLSISYSGLVLNPAEAPDAAEVEDSFKTVFSGRKGELEKNVPAYHIQGRRLPGAGLRDIRAVMPMDRVKAVCRRMDCSVTDLLTGLMLDALQKLYRADDDPKKRSVVKVSVPVNLRPRYGSRTVRNFSSYVNLGMDIQSGYLPLEQLVRLVKMQNRGEKARHRPHQQAPRRQILLADPVQPGPGTCAGRDAPVRDRVRLHPGPPARQQRRRVLHRLRRQAVPAPVPEHLRGGIRAVLPGPGGLSRPPRRGFPPYSRLTGASRRR